MKGYTIGVELFKRESNFDTDQDPVVRIHAGRLRRMLKMYYLEKGRQDPVKIDIPKGNYIPIFQSNTYFADKIDKAQSERRQHPVEPIVAIQPFKNLTGNPDKDYFALGFSEELSVELTKFEDLIVFNDISLSGTENPNPDKMGYVRNQGIRFLIEGTVNLDEARVKVLVKLSDTIQRKQIWAERYVRDLSLTNLIEIQENIAYEIAGELGSEYGIILQQLTAEAKRTKPEILDTYHAILKFHYYEAHHTPEAAMEARNALERAILKEPDSGIANAMLAILYGTQYQLDLPAARESYNKMTELAKKALMLDPNSITVRVMYVHKCFVVDDEERFFMEADKCLSMHPNSPVRLGSVGFYLSLYGDWERGKAILDEVMSRNIHFPHFYYGATMLYYYRTKQFEQALKEANQYDIPALFWGPMLRTAVLGQLNRVEDAKPHIDHLKQLKPDFDKKANYLISRYVKEKALVEQILEGLRKTGLDIPSASGN